jgi:hypothetical protein
MHRRPLRRGIADADVLDRQAEAIAHRAQAIGRSSSSRAYSALSLFIKRDSQPNAQQAGSFG